ncbi:coil containing protein [Vibrio phage 1.086.O._10N.222.51.F8]|nr:coil containing protein [Vibrio phage 1.086.O._10N.222.51.F8]
MQKYISKKVVHAEPMTSGKWQEVRSGFEKYSDATLEPGIDGYHVVYGTGTDNEYHSWSPKDQFEDGNILSTAGEYGINHDGEHIDIIFGDGMTGVQSLGYECGMAGIVICRDGKHNEPFGFNDDKDTFLSDKDKVFIRADKVKSLQVIIDRLEEAKQFIK